MNKDDLIKMINESPDGKESIAFNYAKYKAAGVSEERWNRHVRYCEFKLESIINDCPYETNSPIVYMRKDHKDNDGSPVVFLEIYGPSALVNITRVLFQPTENLYVALNLYYSNNNNFIDKMMPDQKNHFMKLVVEINATIDSIINDTSVSTDTISSKEEEKEVEPSSNIEQEEVIFEEDSNLKYILLPNFKLSGGKDN
jgi:hypothetical protein